MGIRGFWPIVKKHGKHLNNAKYDYVIVDATMLTINFSMAICRLRSDLFTVVMRNTFDSRIKKLRQLLRNPESDEKLIFVFDPLMKPAEKIRPRDTSVLDELPENAFNVFFDLLREGHYTITQSTDHEADHEMAMAYKQIVSQGNTAAVYTEDSDLLVLVPEIIRFDFMLYTVMDICHGLGVTKKIFIEACNTAANDYNTSSMTFRQAITQAINQMP